jgi:dTDP-4-dehydrorhamnose reductase
MNVLLLGAGGMLARSLQQSVPSVVELTALSRAACDITNVDAVREAVHAVRPEWIVNAAAYTAVDRAESERELAHRVNAEAPGVIGRAAADVGATVLHLSTDYVFPGTGTTPWREDDAHAPLNWYGSTKHEGELALAASGARALVVRVQWLYGTAGHSFARTMLGRATARSATRVVNDQHGTPTFTEDLAPALWECVSRDFTGTLHLANRGVTTWFAVAERIFDALGARDCLSACTTAEYPTPARRPANGALDLRRAAEAGVQLPAWDDALDRWLYAIRGATGA